MDGSPEGQAGVAIRRGISKAFSTLTPQEKAPTGSVGCCGGSITALHQIPEIQADPSAAAPLLRVRASVEPI
jgi:hypothetical protein